MSWLSFEIKARCSDLVRVRGILKACRAEFQGLDRQIDTYFRVPSGRLKLREGKIENALIYYKRADQKNSKRCDAVLCECRDAGTIKKILGIACGILTVVDKKREIFFFGNVKFHLDRVKGLGNFVEIEAQDKSGKFGPAKIQKQCDFFQKLLGVRPQDLLADSYSDQVLSRGIG